MRTRLMSTALGTSLAAGALYFTFGAVGCTVVSSDSTTDTGVVVTDTNPAPDTGTPDTTPTADTGTGHVVTVPAVQLITSSIADATLVHDFGGGSTRDDLVGNRLYDAFALACTDDGKTDTICATGIGSTEIGKGAGDTLVDGKITGLPNGTATYKITVTGYLRGFNGDLAVAPAHDDAHRVKWAQVNCTVKYDGSADVTATCTPLKLIAADGVVFTSDILPDGYCAGKGASTTAGFSILRARNPDTGTVVVSRTTDDCLGVVYVTKASLALGTATTAPFRLSLESKDGTISACTANSTCSVDFNSAHIVIVGGSASAANKCPLNASNTTPSSCF